MPLTLAVVFVVMAATGKNFDRITLGSLILALGLLVDDAIIAIEMMVVKMEEGYDRAAASAYAWSHTAAPMLAGTLVTAVGFMPNASRLTAGEYTSNMFWIVGIALIASWVVAVAFTPYLGVKMLPNFRSSKAVTMRSTTRPANRFRQLLTRVIARKWLVAGSVVALFVLAMLGMAVVRSSFSRSPIAQCWSGCRCRTARRFRKQAPPRRRSRRGSRSRRSEDRHRVRRGAPRFIWRWGRNCPIRRSRRS